MSEIYLSQILRTEIDKKPISEPAAVIINKSYT